MDNPFVYGEVVPPAAFVNRVVELDRLIHDLEAGQKIFLISPRRYGKSSLVRQALAAMSRQGALTVEVTVSSFSSYVAFLEGYARALLATETGWDRAKAWLVSAIGSTRPEVRYESFAATEPGRERARPKPGTTRDQGSRGQSRSSRPARESHSARTARARGGLTVTFPTVRTDRDVSRLAEEVFALPARLAAARRRRVVVALDEFQAINGFNGGSVEHALRAAVQHQREVGYVFAGSEPSLMEQMLTPKRPFYKAGPVMRLEKIPAGEFAEFIEARFTKSGIRPEPGVGAAVVELAGNLPYDVQRLAHETWDHVRAAGGKRVTLDDLHFALRQLLTEQQSLFEAQWQRLTLAQRAVLRAVVLEDGRGVLSADARTRHRLGGPSTVQAALGALLRDDVIGREGDRYGVVDSLLREWVARRTY